MTKNLRHQLPWLVYAPFNTPPFFLQHQDSGLCRLAKGACAHGYGVGSSQSGPDDLRCRSGDTFGNPPENTDNTTSSLVLLSFVISLVKPSMSFDYCVHTK